MTNRDTTTLSNPSRSLLPDTGWMDSASRVFSHFSGGSFAASGLGHTVSASPRCLERWEGEGGSITAPPRAAHG